MLRLGMRTCEQCVQFLGARLHSREMAHFPVVTADVEVRRATKTFFWNIHGSAMRALRKHALETIWLNSCVGVVVDGHKGKRHVRHHVAMGCAETLMTAADLRKIIAACVVTETHRATWIRLLPPTPTQDSETSKAVLRCTRKAARMFC